MKFPVLPKWVTQIGVVGVILSGLSQVLGEALGQVFLDSQIAMYIATISGIATALGAALGDKNSNGIPDVIDEYLGT